MSDNAQVTSELSTVTLRDFYSRLSERVSSHNAKLLMQSVVVGSGVRQADDSPLKVEDARTICLELIKKGGPAFQVGKAMYGEVQ